MLARSEPSLWHLVVGCLMQALLTFNHGGGLKNGWLERKISVCWRPDRSVPHTMNS